MTSPTPSDTITGLFEIKNALFAQMDIVNDLIDKQSSPSTPQLAKFKVTLEFTTDPNDWGIESVDEYTMRNQINKCMPNIIEALEFDDESDEVKLLEVERVG